MNKNSVCTLKMISRDTLVSCFLHNTPEPLGSTEGLDTELTLPCTEGLDTPRDTCRQPGPHNLCLLIQRLAVLYVLMTILKSP